MTREPDAAHESDPLDPHVEEAAEAATDPEFEAWDSLVERSPELTDIIVQLKQIQRIARRHERAGLAAGAVSPAARGVPASPDLPSVRGLTRWGPLVLREELGAGTSGVTLRAFDPQLQREVALKLQPTGPGRPERALAEARRLAQVRHANVLSIHGADSFEGFAGIWTDLLEGETLEEKLQREGPLSEAEVVSIGIDLCRALRAVHRARLVHGDVKAANVMNEDDGSIVLLDFGSGRVLERGSSTSSPSAALSPSSATSPSTARQQLATSQSAIELEASLAEETHRAVSGTPLAMAPEMFEGVDPNPRTDIYALGTLLYRLALGTYPVLAETIEELIARHRNRVTADFRTVDVALTEEFVEIVGRALSPDPGQRFGTAQEMEEALTRISSLQIEERLALRRATCPNNIPRSLSSFVGRQALVRELAESLSQRRLITLTGTGGAGKTRLAEAVAIRLLVGRFDEVRFVDLAALEDPDRVPSAIGAVLGLREDHSRDWLAAITDRLAGSETLLLLDNCEHLLAAAAATVHELLVSSPDLRILCTSREALGVTGEQVWEVPPLELPALRAAPGRSGDPRQSGSMDSGGTTPPVLPVGVGQSPDPGDPLRSMDPVDAGKPVESVESVESVALFLARARDAGAQIELDAGNVAAVIGICRRLDGIPLAIELAAARARMLPPEVILQRLDDRFGFLSSRGTGDPRHQTLSSMIDWSYELLTEKERTLFRRFAVFVDGATLEATEAICGGGTIDREEVLDLVSRLVERNLIEVDRRRSRYRMLETIRTYAIGKLTVSGEEPAVVGHHREYFMDLVARVRARVRRSGEAIWIQRFRADRENVRKALENAESDGRLGFEANFVLLSSLTGSWREGVTVGERGIARVRRDREAWADVDGERIVSSAGGIPGDESAYFCDLLRFTASLHIQFGELEESARWLREALDIAESLEDAGRQFATHGVLGNLAMASGHLEESKAEHTKAVSIASGIGDSVGVAVGLSGLGSVLRAQGDTAGARRHFEKSIEASRLGGDARTAAYCLCLVAYIDETKMRLEPARQAYEESLTIRRELGDLWGISASLTGLSGVLRRQGDFAGAVQLIEEALEILAAMGDRISWVRGMSVLAIVQYDQGDLSAVRVTLREVVLQSRRIGAIHDLSAALVLLATLLLDEGNVEDAGVILGAEAPIRASSAYAIQEEVARSFESQTKRLRESLGEDADRCLERGSVMNVDEVVEMALELIDRGTDR